MIKYPFTINDLMNTDALAKAILALQEEVKNFVVANTIKYADPIQWNITTQYERNTVVIDPLTGTAYISVQPVPMGISLANTDYWTVVFNLSEFVTRAARNFSLNYEETTTLTATFPTVKGGWLVWNDTLYVANVNITPGDQYVDEVGGNITRITMESIIGNMDNLLTTHKDNMVNIINEVFGAYTTLDAIIGDMSTLDVPGVTTVVAALNVLYTAVDNIANAIIDINNAIGDLDNLNTTDKTSIVAAVNEVLSNVNDVDTKVGNLDDLNTTDKTSIVAAVNEVLSDTDDVDDKVGDLSDLHTTVKTSIVDAINDIESIVTAGNYLNVKDFGAAGDGVADDTTAIQAAFDEACNSKMALYFPAGVYCISDTLDFSNTSYYTIFGENSLSYIKATQALNPMIKLSNNDSLYYGQRTISGLIIDGDNIATMGIEASNARYSVFTHLRFLRITGICLNSGSWVNNIQLCSFEDSGTGIVLSNVVNNIVIRNCDFDRITKGIKCEGSHDLKILECTFDVCNVCAIELAQASDNTIIENNYFEYCGRSGGVDVTTENNTVITFNGTIIAYGDRSVPLTYYHANLVIQGNYFTNCLPDQILCLSHVSNVTFTKNGFENNYNSIVKFMWHGSNYLFSELSIIEASNSRESSFVKAATIDVTNSGVDVTNVKARIIEKLKYNTSPETSNVIDLMSIDNVDGNVTETGTATHSGYYGGNKVYTLSSDFDRSVDIDLINSDLRNKLISLEALCKNDLGASNGVWLHVLFDGVEAYSKYVTTNENTFRVVTFGANLVVPNSANVMTVRVHPTYSNSDVYLTKLFVTT